MASPAVWRERLKELAREEGFELAGVVEAAPSEHLKFVEGWVEKGYHGEMGYLARPDALSRRGDPRRTLPEVRSILVVGQNYHQPDPAGVPEDSSRGVIARYARGRDYHRLLKKGLQRIHRRLEEELGHPVTARAYVDTGPILERELGERAGLGWFGRNTMLIHPRKGSYFFLGSLFMELEVEPDSPFQADHCGSCRACLDACPTGALLGRDASGAPVMDATRCISYLTIEHRGSIPEELRPLMGNRVYGCDICQEVCPFSRKFSCTSGERSYAARGPGDPPVGVQQDSSIPEISHPGTDGPPLMELLAMALSEDSWEAFSRGSAIRRAGRAAFARNVCVALGNWGETEAASVLAHALRGPEPLVRGHAAWALGRIGSSGDLLRARLEVESDVWVREEITRALDSTSGTSFGSRGAPAR